MVGAAKARSSAFVHAFLRPVISLALVSIATLLLAPAILVNWSRSQIYDSEAFTESAVVALEEDPVRSALVGAIVDEIVLAGSSEAIAVRPLIQFVTATVVDSRAFEDIYRDAVRQLHRDMFEQDSRAAEPVALTLVDAVIVITAFLQEAYPDVAEQLPPNLENAFVEIRSRDWAVDAVVLGENAESAAIALPVAVAFLYACALLLSRDRRQTFLFMGIGWMAVAILILLGRDYAREFVLGQGFTDQAVSRAIWEVYTRSLIGWAALVGGIGLVAAVAGGGAHRASPVKQLDLARRVVSHVPKAQWAKVGRAAAFVGAGVLVIAQRDQILTLAVLSLAAYLIYYGLTELIWLAGQGTPVRDGKGFVRRPAPMPAWAIRAGAVAGLFAAGVGGFLYVSRAVDTASGEAIPRLAIEQCNGHEVLCERKLDEVTFLATHNSMAAADEPGWYFANQLTGIREQLDAGVRALLLDTHYGFATRNGVRTADRDIVKEVLPPDEFSEPIIGAARRLAKLIGAADTDRPRGTYLCHVFCELGATPLSQALTEINQFLEENRSEVIFLFLQDHISPEDTAKAFIASGLVKRVYQLERGQPLPTLRRLIERDQRVLVFADNDASGVDWYMRARDFVQDTAFRVESPAGFSCSLSRGEDQNPLFALNHWISGTIPSVGLARQINDFDALYERVVSCESQRLQKVNFLVVNFFEIGDAALLVDFLNGVAEPTAIR